MSLESRLQGRARREVLARTTACRGVARAAVIGCGQIAPEHIAGYEECAAARTVAISDVRAGSMAPHLARYDRVRTFRDYRQMLEEMRPEIVSICTWPQHHLEIVRTVLQYPVLKGILCEKPIALQMAEIEEMLRICNAAGVKLGIGHQYRFHPYFEFAAKMIQRGALGSIVEVRGSIKDSVANNGPHLLDTIRFLLGDRPVTEVVAAFEGFGNVVNRGWSVEDSATGTLTFNDGVLASLRLGSAAPNFFEIEVIGKTAALRVSADGVRMDDKPATAEGPDVAWYRCRRRQFDEFVQWVRGRRATYAAS